MRNVPWVGLVLALACGGGTEDDGTGGTSSGGSATGGAGSGGAGNGGASSGGASGGSGSASTGGSAGAGTSGVACQGKTCTAGQYCCHPSCVAEGSACSGFALYCDDAGDCPGALCCAKAPAAGGFPEAHCTQSCDADGEMVVCRLGVPGSCPSGLSCQITAKLPPEFGFCG